MALEATIALAIAFLAIAMHGLTFGNLGPVSEGFIAWLAGTGALIGLIRFIGTSVGEET